LSARVTPLRAFKERMQQFEIYLEQLRVQAEMIIHAHGIRREPIWREQFAQCLTTIPLPP